MWDGALGNKRATLALVIGRSPGEPYHWPGKLLLTPSGEIHCWSDEWWAKRVTVVVGDGTIVDEI